MPRFLCEIGIGFGCGSGGHVGSLFGSVVSGIEASFLEREREARELKMGEESGRSERVGWWCFLFWRGFEF